MAQPTCLNHPDRPGALRCRNCGRPFCADCLSDGPDGGYCDAPECREALQRRLLPQTVPCRNCNRRVRLTPDQRRTSRFVCPGCGREHTPEDGNMLRWRAAALAAQPAGERPEGAPESRRDGGYIARMLVFGTLMFWVIFTMVGGLLYFLADALDPTLYMSDTWKNRLILSSLVISMGVTIALARRGRLPGLRPHEPAPPRDDDDDVVV